MGIYKTKKKSVNCRSLESNQTKGKLQTRLYWTIFNICFHEQIWFNKTGSAIFILHLGLIALEKSTFHLQFNWVWPWESVEIETSMTPPSISLSGIQFSIPMYLNHWSRRTGKKYNNTQMKSGRLFIAATQNLTSAEMKIADSVLLSLFMRDNAQHLSRPSSTA